MTTHTPKHKLSGGGGIDQHISFVVDELISYFQGPADIPAFIAYQALTGRSAPNNVQWNEVKLIATRKYREINSLPAK